MNQEAKLRLDTGKPMSGMTITREPDSLKLGLSPNPDISEAVRG